MIPKPIPRKTAYSPRSASWTLYKPEVLAEKLDMPVDVVDTALEETGFHKAVKIRELIIEWKTDLIQEQRNLHFSREGLQKELSGIKQREKEVREMLVRIRNILRIPREKDDNADELYPT